MADLVWDSSSSRSYDRSRIISLQTANFFACGIQYNEADRHTELKERTGGSGKTSEAFTNSLFDG
jgi:hypothetical protein